MAKSPIVRWCTFYALRTQLSINNDLSINDNQYQRENDVRPNKTKKVTRRLIFLYLHIQLLYNDKYLIFLDLEKAPKISVLDVYQMFIGM